jgi:hemoglobin
MKTTLHIALLACSLALAAPVFADDDALYEQLGGQPGLVKLVDAFLPRVQADERLAPFFKDVNRDYLKGQLVAEFCQLTGGPCTRKGPDMKHAHEAFDIDRSSFNAVVEVLQEAMDDQGIDFATQNRLLARLAPLHRDIINVD